MLPIFSTGILSLRRGGSMLLPIVVCPDFRRGNLFLRHVADKFGIAGRAHFRDVEAGDFHFGTDAVGAEPAADQLENRAGDDDVPSDARYGGDDLGDEL